MTELIVKRTGKLLFPHLPRALRNQQLSKLMLIILATVFGNAMLVYCMMRGWH